MKIRPPPFLTPRRRTTLSQGYTVYISLPCTSKVALGTPLPPNAQPRRAVRPLSKQFNVEPCLVSPQLSHHQGLRRDPPNRS